MQYTPNNALRATVLDVDSGERIERVVCVDDVAGTVEKHVFPFVIDRSNDTIKSEVLRFGRIEAVREGVKVKELRCYGRVTDERLRKVSMSVKQLINAELAALEAEIRKSVNAFIASTGLPICIRLNYEQGEPRVAGGADVWLTTIEIDTARKTAVFNAVGASGGSE